MTVSSNPNYSQDRIFDKFMELFDLEELKLIFDKMLPDSELKKLVVASDDALDETHKDDFCRSLLELIGDNFFNKLPDNNKDKLGFLRYAIILKSCKENNIDEQTIVDEYNVSHTAQEDTLKSLCVSQYFIKNSYWKYFITEEFLDIPESVITKRSEPPKEEETTPLRKRPKLKPLHDYQYQSVNKIINMLTNKNESKKAVFINLPTGAGKTRLTVEAIIEFINLKNQNKLEGAHEQQKNGKIIFWFASTIELCKQAADEFISIFDSIGIGTQVYLTRYYEGRRKLNDIINDYEGIHIVVTNTEHFLTELRNANDDNSKERYLVNRYTKDTFFVQLRNKTMCVVVDEAHEITSKSYRRFVAAMGFDNSGTNESKVNFSRNNVILIGLSATAYKGSGLETFFECENDYCGFGSVDPNKLIAHAKKFQHYCSLSDNTDKSGPEILKNFNPGTKTIFSMFQNNIYVPLPHEDTTISNPVAIIDIPSSCVIGEHVKFSALDSFDRSSDIKYRWEIRKTSLDTAPVIREDSYFSYPFESEGQYTVKLRVTSLSDETKFDEKTMSLEVYDKGKCFEGTIEDNQKFYDILTKRQILCPVTHGVIIGPRVILVDGFAGKIKTSGFEEQSNREIVRDLKYNQTVLSLVKKCLTEYGREKVLIFANSVEHANLLSQIIKLNYKREFKINSAVVTGETRPGQRRKIIQDFKDGIINVLVNFGVLTTGFDVPTIDTLIISRLVVSNSLMTQMIGRGQRGLKSRGTEDLWLFTSNFLDPNHSIPLGWEVTAQQWSSFTKEQQDDLHVTSSIARSHTPVQTPTIPKEKHIEFIIEKNTPIFQCTQCKKQGKGFEQIQTVFGITYPTFNQFTNAVDNGTFRTVTRNAKCKFCRETNRIMNNCSCEFTQNFSKIHNFQRHNIFIAKLALSKLDSNKFSQHELVEIFDKLKMNQNQLNDIHSKLENKLYSLETYTFTKISQPDKLKNLLNLIESQQNYVPNTSPSKSLESNAESNAESNTESNAESNVEMTFSEIKGNDESQKFFYEIRGVLGHSPTSRQFNKLIKYDESKLNFKKSYDGRFNLLISELRDVPIPDPNLENLLFDEFFEKCLSEGKLISNNDLDQHGQFRIEDYKETFDSYTNFKSLIQKVLHKVLSSKIENNFSLVDVLNDYSTICQLKSGNSPNFEDIFMYSKIGIEKYIQKHIPFSLIPLLHENTNQYSEKELESFLLLLVSFFKLRNILGSIPVEHVLLRFLDTETKSFYQHNFSTIDKFFNHIGIDCDSEIFGKQHVRMEKYVMHYIDKLHGSTKSQQTILQKIIDFVFSNSDYNSSNLAKPQLELAIQIDNFIVNKNVLNNFL